MLVAFGLMLLGYGTAFNAAVLIANDGEMPLVINIGKQEEVMIGSVIMPASRSPAKLLWLADRFHLRYPEITVPQGEIFAPVRWWLSALKYPTNDMIRSASVGDFMNDAGSIIFLLLLPALLVRILFRGFTNMSSFGTWRGE
jgi:hypothetical protein